MQKQHQALPHWFTKIPPLLSKVVYFCCLIRSQHSPSAYGFLSHVLASGAVNMFMILKGYIFQENFCMDIRIMILVKRKNLAAQNALFLNKQARYYL